MGIDEGMREYQDKILLVKTTSQLMQYTTDVRGVGGAVDVVTITRMGGCENVQSKQIRGERSAN